MNIEELKNKLIDLSNVLRKRGNAAHVFFDKILEELDQEDVSEPIGKLKSCYSMTQYADFNSNEEKLLEEIITLAQMQ